MNEKDIHSSTERESITVAGGEGGENNGLQSPANTEENTIVFQRSHLYAVLLPLAFVVGLSVGYLFWGRSASSALFAQANTTSRSAVSIPGDNQAEAQTSAQAPAQSASQAESRDVRRYEVPIDDDPTLGPEDAPITLIEFSDYECPFCRRWHTEVFPRLKDAYSDQIRFVYRDFPLTSIHENAISAAEASNCAREQNMFWEYHDRLFSMQYGLGRDAYSKYAADMELDLTAFEECLDSNRYQQEVQADYEFAAQMGIRSTPTFFINGLAVVGAQPFEVFQQIIDQELAGQIP